MRVMSGYQSSGEARGHADHAEHDQKFFKAKTFIWSIFQFYKFETLFTQTHWRTQLLQIRTF